ncbi:sulfur carrier protein ThiS [Plantactinospora sp. GCM10030261]|uniref:sulfur carrier protein ThiS n=1 Tax=Plantactinospora sp. GCM10030261 TaxID=3273420 RepID=UPI00360A6E95
MELTVNGTTRRLPSGTTLTGLVDTLTTVHRGLAVAVNGEVVRRADWPTTPLRSGDRVEVLTAAQGG